MPPICSNTPSNMLGLMINSQSAGSGTLGTCNAKAVVVGVYGIPGSGKTFLLNELKQEFRTEKFAFYEGSEMIATVVPGGLEAFQKLGEEEKVYWRQLAIDTIREKSADRGQVAVVTGHFMFWNEEEETGRLVYTRKDLETFTHILYLDVPAEVVGRYRSGEKERSRPSASISHLRKWQQAEKTQLRRLCLDHGILFSLVTPHPTILTKVSMLLHDFQHHTENYNLSQAKSRLDEALSDQDQLETVLVIDGDKTLAAEDTGALFWEKVSSSRQQDNEEYPLKTLFSSALGYSYTGFRQAMLLYEETVDEQGFEAICQDVATEVSMHSEFLFLLRLVAEKEHVGAVVVTCGLRRVWEKVLIREGLSETVKVIGGGRIADGFVVTPTVKAALVVRLQDVHQTYVCALGDSPLDMDMMSKADQPIIVVGEEDTRSKSMDAILKNAIENDGLQAYQVVLPSHASPRLDTSKLPLIQLTGNDFIHTILGRRNGLQVVHATDRNAAKLLATPMRDAAVAGPFLREAHRRAGWYLATKFLTNEIGLEEYQTSHVLGHLTSGYRLLHEKETTIVALMRGGEPMALGVSDAFPLAMFVHASNADDMKAHHIEKRRTVVLVDSVVNSGKTIVEFVQAIRKRHTTIRIIVVAGVVQALCIRKDSPINQALVGRDSLSIIALRLSDTKFTGSGTTDTGNRLFNTTHLV